jgi:cytochrome c biogenesis protein CcmG/thiol:disulfide interchange protein DsbE|tara:strand:- start:380 stop:883 length:504 start_codon:yes stop_codon:yes gene_type:complete
MSRILPLLFFLLTLALFLFWLVSGGAKENPSPLIGKSAPQSDIEFTDSNGSKKSLNNLLREPGYKLINFWASWCLPCKVEHPSLMALKEKNNLIMIGINYKDQNSEAKNFIERNGNPYNFIGIDGNGYFGIDMGITGVPETFIIDGEGKIILRHVGPIDFLSDYLVP